MKFSKWLIVKRNTSARITKNRPALDSDEIAIKLNLELPDALFTKPHLEATVVVPDEVAAQELISSQTIDSAKAAIEQATGLEFVVSIAQKDLEADDKLLIDVLEGKHEPVQ